MDADGFDALARTLGSRRSVLRGLIGAVAAVVARSEVAGQTTVCLAPGLKCRKSGQCCSGGCKKRRGRRTGKCKPCAAGQVYCAGVPACLGCCSDEDCGGNPCDNVSCAACPRGKKLCNGICVDTSNDQAHCGDCNRTCNGDFCSGGTCYCKTFCNICTRCCGIFGCSHYDCGCTWQWCGGYHPC